MDPNALLRLILDHLIEATEWEAKAKDLELPDREREHARWSAGLAKHNAALSLEELATWLDKDGFPPGVFDLNETGYPRSGFEFFAVSK